MIRSAIGDSEDLPDYLLSQVLDMFEEKAYCLIIIEEWTIF